MNAIVPSALRDDCIALWARYSLRDLTICYLVAGESGGEAERRDVQERYALQMCCVEAMGKYRFGVTEWERELEHTFETYGRPASLSRSTSPSPPESPST